MLKISKVVGKLILLFLKFFSRTPGTNFYGNKKLHKYSFAFTYEQIIKIINIVGQFAIISTLNSRLNFTSITKPINRRVK